MAFDPYAYEGIAEQASQKYGIPSNLFLAQLQQESGFDPGAYNATSGATGIAQFLPSTAANPGYGISPFDPTDPVASINAAAQYDAALYGKTGSYAGMLNAYGTTAGGAAPGLADAAAALDAGQGTDSGSSGGGFLSGISNWFNGLDFSNPVQLGQSLSGVGSSTSSAGSVLQNDIGQIEASVGNFAQRGGLVLLGLIFVGVGLMMFKPVSQTIVRTAKAVT